MLLWLWCTYWSLIRRFLFVCTTVVDRFVMNSIRWVQTYSKILPSQIKYNFFADKISFYIARDFFSLSLSNASLELIQMAYFMSELEIPCHQRRLFFSISSICSLQKWCFPGFAVLAIELLIAGYFGSKSSPNKCKLIAAMT